MTRASLLPPASLAEMHALFERTNPRPEAAGSGLAWVSSPTMAGGATKGG
jgi:hypothetical protein